VTAHLVDDSNDIDPTWLLGKKKSGVTADASAPEALITEVIHHLQELTGATVREFDGVLETTVFPLPKGLQEKS